MRWLANAGLTIGPMIGSVPDVKSFWKLSERAASCRIWNGRSLPLSVPAKVTVICRLSPASAISTLLLPAHCTLSYTWKLLGKVLHCRCVSTLSCVLGDFRFIFCCEVSMFSLSSTSSISPFLYDVLHGNVDFPSTSLLVGKDCFWKSLSNVAPFLLVITTTSACTITEVRI